MNKLNTSVIIALFALASVNGQTPVTYTGINCSANRTDAFCNANAAAGPGGMCCATVIQSSRASATATTWTNATSYQCLPAETANKLGTIAYTTLLNYTYSCTNGSTVQEPASCSSNVCGDGLCCASRGAMIGNSSTVYTLPSYCTAKTTANSTWAIGAVGTTTQAVMQTRVCAYEPDNAFGLSTLFGLALTFLLFALL